MCAADDRYNHSEKGRARWRRYKATEKGRAADARYDSSPKGMQTRTRWYLNVRRPRDLGAQRERIVGELEALTADYQEFLAELGISPPVQEEKPPVQDENFFEDLIAIHIPELAA